jgi:hypothetical protein
MAALTTGLRGLRLAEQAGDRRPHRLQATLGVLYVKLEDYPAPYLCYRLRCKVTSRATIQL